MAVDPFWANVVLLLHCDGVDASTVFTDVSNVGRTITAEGNAQVDTAQSKFGGASSLYDGANDFLSMDDSTSLDLSADNDDQYTIEMWVRPNGVTGTKFLYGQRQTSFGRTGAMMKMQAANLEFAFDNGTSTVTITGTGNPFVTNTWKHVAVDKDSSGKIRLYVEGVMVGSSTPANSAIRTDHTDDWTIGCTVNFQEDFTGHIDEIRVTKGVARYASDSGYTVPTAAFPETAIEVTSCSPGGGGTAGGTSVTISGAGFTDATGVLFDASSATSFVVVNDTTITCVTPAHSAATVNVTVQHPVENGILVNGFVYSGGTPPDFTSISPNSGPVSGGTSVTITGTNLTDVTAVEFDNVAATSVVVVNSTTVTCVTPARPAGLSDVEVINPYGSDTGVDAFEYLLSARVTQLPLLVINQAIQPTRITQVPLLVVNLPIQGTKITQLPILPVWEPNPIPLPSPIVPEIPVTEIWQWKTVVNIAEGGKEQRSALRAHPRHGLSFSALILDEEDRRNTYQMLFKYIKQAFDYPNYVHSAKLTAAAVAGATRLYFDPAATDIRVGESLALFDTVLEQTIFVTVVTIHADGATVTALEADAAESWLVCPAPRFRTTPVVGFNMRGLDGEFSLKLETTVVRDVQRPGAAPTLTTLDGMLVLHNRPLADNDVDEEFDQNVEWLDNQVSPPEVKTNWRIPFVSGKRQYLIHRPSGMDYWRAVAANLKGRQNPFLLPTFRNDLPLSEVPALGATHLISSNIQFFDFWREKAYRYVRIDTANGAIYRRILEVLANYNANGDPISVDIKLSSAIGGNPGDNTISAVSFTNIVRLDSDEVTLVHGAVDTVVTLAIRAINE